MANQQRTPSNFTELLPNTANGNQHWRNIHDDFALDIKLSDTVTVSYKSTFFVLFICQCFLKTVSEVRFTILVLNFHDHSNVHIN